MSTLPRWYNTASLHPPKRIEREHNHEDNAWEDFEREQRRQEFLSQHCPINNQNEITNETP